MAVDENAVARLEMSRTAELIASESWVALLARKRATSARRFALPLYWSAPQPGVGQAALTPPLSALIFAPGRLLSPNGSPSVMSTTALAWQAVHSARWLLFEFAEVKPPDDGLPVFSQLLPKVAV